MVATTYHHSDSEIRTFSDLLKAAQYCAAFKRSEKVRISESELVSVGPSLKKILFAVTIIQIICGKVERYFFLNFGGWVNMHVFFVFYINLAKSICRCWLP